EVERSGLPQAIAQCAPGGLQTDDTVGRLGELVLLLRERMRRVVGCDALDRPVRHCLQQRLDVALASKRRRHLEVGIPAPHGLVGEQEMMRRGLGRDGNPPRALASFSRRTAPAVETCAMCTWAPVSSASTMSRATMTSSAAAGWPVSPSSVETNPSFITPR